MKRAHDTDFGMEAILDFPWEVLEYLSWLRQQPATRDAVGSYSFDAPKLRFGALETDVVVADPQLRLETDAGRLRLTSPRAPLGVSIEGLAPADRKAVLALLAQLDGERTLAEVRARRGGDGRVLGLLMSAAFGSLLFAPLSVMAAEQGISGVEITRFPASPYEISRPYWKNMAAVRARLGDLDAAVNDDEHFLRELCKLHVLALLGEDLQTYYQPASPISGGRAAPGRLMRTPTELIDTPDGCLFLSGPRVNAAPVGGVRYHEALYQTLGEPEAALHRRFVDDGGLDWGRLVRAKAVADPAFGDWFCPPRPLRAEHVAALRRSLSTALDGVAGSDRERCLNSLAEFHREFVRLHPFYCGNQCLAMNIVNRILGQLLGAGIPHLMLDHLALRLSAPAYVSVFRRCVAAYLDPQPSAAARYLRLASHRTRTFELLHKLQNATELEQAWAAIQADTDSARLLMLIE